LSAFNTWAERCDRDLADIFALQDEIAEAVTIAIAPAIAGAERHRAMRNPPESLDARAAYQRGLWYDSLLKESLRTSVVVWIGFAHVPDAALIGGPGV
jgi:hypothetical protein